MTSENKIIDLIEVSENGIVHVREKIYTIDNGVEKAVFHRTSIEPGQDYSKFSDEVIKVCSEAHTHIVIENYKRSLEQFSIKFQTIPEDQQ